MKMDGVGRIKVLWASVTELVAGHSNSTTVHSFYHLLSVRYGEDTFVCGGTAYRMTKGTCIMVLPGTYHEIPANEHNLMGFYEVKFEVLDPYLDENLRKLASVVFHGNAFFETVMDYICVNYFHEENEIRANVDSLLAALLIYMFLDRAMPKKHASKHLDCSGFNQSTQAALEFIENRYSGPISLAKMGEELGMNPNYLCGNFKKSTGYPVTEYVNFVRVMDALLTLYFRKTTPLNEVAFQVGFGSVSSFNRSFKKLLGIPPSDFICYLEHHAHGSCNGIRYIHDSLLIRRYGSISEAIGELKIISKIVQADLG